MDIVFLLLPLSLFLGLVFLAGYCWAARNGQFDDLQTPAIRILPDDESITKCNGGLSGK